MTVSEEIKEEERKLQELQKKKEDLERKKREGEEAAQQLGNTSSSDLISSIFG